MVWTKTRETIALPVAGIMSDVPCGTIADKYLNLSERVRDMGSYLKAPFYDSFVYVFTGDSRAKARGRRSF